MRFWGGWFDENFECEVLVVVHIKGVIGFSVFGFRFSTISRIV